MNTEPENKTGDSLARLAEQAADTIEHKAELGRDIQATQQRKLQRQTPWHIYALLALVLTLWFQGPRMMDPYYGEDSLSTDAKAQAYLMVLANELLASRARSGNFPASLDAAGMAEKLPDASTGYRVEYKSDGGAASLSLLRPHGAAPLSMQVEP